MIFEEKPAQQIFTGELECGPKDYGPVNHAPGPFFTSHKQVHKKEEGIEHATIYMNAKFESEQKLIQNEGIEHARKQREASTIAAVATITCLGFLTLQT